LSLIFLVLTDKTGFLVVAIQEFLLLCGRQIFLKWDLKPPCVYFLINLLQWHCFWATLGHKVDHGQDSVAIFAMKSGERKMQQAWACDLVKMASCYSTSFHTMRNTDHFSRVSTLYSSTSTKFRPSFCSEFLPLSLFVTPCSARPLWAQHWSNVSCPLFQ
jgi:hypothetical protein